MENTVKAFENQTILDIALQYTGSVSNSFKIAEANGKCITDLVSAGEFLIIPDGIISEILTVKNYQNKQIKPATEKAQNVSLAGSEVPILKGIGYMQIGSTFKVS